MGSYYFFFCWRSGANSFQSHFCQAVFGDGGTFSRTQICCVRCAQVGASRCSFSNNMIAWLAAAQFKHQHLHPWHQHGVAQRPSSPRLSFLFPPTLWEILRWYCTLFGSPPFSSAIKGQSFSWRIPKGPSCFVGECTDRSVAEQW